MVSPTLSYSHSLCAFLRQYNERDKQNKLANRFQGTTNLINLIKTVTFSLRLIRGILPVDCRKCRSEKYGETALQQGTKLIQ